MTRSRIAVDAGVALAVFGLTLGLLAADGFGEPDGAVRHLDARGIALAALSTLPLVARRFAPLATYLATACGTLALLGFGYPLDVPFGAGVAIYQLGQTFGGDRRPVRRWMAILAAALLTPAALELYMASGKSVMRIWPEMIGLTLIVAGLWLAGDRARLRREQIATLEEHARRVERETERERRLAAAEERTRIARELHDSAGHAINVILVQAGAARLLHERDAAGSLRAIATIEEVAIDTIRDIDRLVRALRTEDGSRSPPANPAAFEELIERHRAGGLAIASRIHGPRDSLPRSVAWAAYRILQEALTNATRHGRGEADVSVVLGPDAASITVTNPIGINPTSLGTAGHGTAGLSTTGLSTSGLSTGGLGASGLDTSGLGATGFGATGLRASGFGTSRAGTNRAGTNRAGANDDGTNGLRTNGNSTNGNSTNGDGTNGSAPGGGHGIVGMRERATLLGGMLRTGVDGGVFRLEARLPYREATS